MPKLRSKIEQLPKWVLPLSLLVLGGALRLAKLGSIPGGYQMDEAYEAWNAFSLYHSGIDSAGKSFPVYFEAWGHGQNALYAYLMLPLIALGGGHVNPIIMRIPQVMISMATLIAVYMIMREIYDRTVANWALFLTAICPWHVMMSRWGLESNLAPGFLLLGLCFFIYSLRKPPLLLLSALCYGLSLYCYATIWPIVPLMLILQGGYCLYKKKLPLTKWLPISIILLGALAFPLVAFLLVNTGYIPEFHIGPFSVYRMTSFRGNELVHSLGDVFRNFKNLLYLFYHQDVGRVYDVIMPYGFFYEIGRLFILIGIPVLLFRTGRAFIKKEFALDTLLLIQLIGAGIVGLLIQVNITQINCAYLPLILCEAIGVTGLISLIVKFLPAFKYPVPESSSKVHPLSAEVKWFPTAIIILIYCVDLIGFQHAYYSDYKEISSAWFQQGTEAAVKTAFSHASERGCDIYVDAGLKYPNVLLFTETTAQEYLDTVIYSEYPPAPEQFTKNNVTFHMGIDFESIAPNDIYICYQTDLDKFDDFTLLQFYDWYIAIP